MKIGTGFKSVSNYKAHAFKHCAILPNESQLHLTLEFSGHFLLKSFRPTALLRMKKQWTYSLSRWIDGCKTEFNLHSFGLTANE